MGSNKRKKKSARKQLPKIPTWFFDRDVPILLKREVEDALARHAADNGIAVASAKFKSLTLQDICASLKLVHARWRAVEPTMINAATQPAMKVLMTHLQESKKRRKMMEQMVADHLKAADDGPPSGEQSSQGSAEEGEEEEAQADDSDGERSGPKPAYAKGNLHELLEEADGEEAANADDQKAGQMIEQIISGIKESSQKTQLRITAEDVRRWTEVGERCNRIQFYWDELEKEESAIDELIKPTPLAFAWKKVKELASDSSASVKSQG